MPTTVAFFVILGCQGGMECRAFDPNTCFDQAVEISFEKQLPYIPPCQLVFEDGYTS